MLKDKYLKPILNEKVEGYTKESLIETAEFLKSLASPENRKAIQERLTHIDVVPISPHTKKAYRRINGELNEFKIPSYAHVWSAPGNIEVIDDEILTDYYIYLKHASLIQSDPNPRPNPLGDRSYSDYTAFLMLDNSRHTIKHEMVRALASPRRAEKVQDNIHSVKSGLSIINQKSLENYQLNCEDLYNNSRFLNEGMTDYLTVLSRDGEIEKYFHLEKIILAKFLVGNDIRSDNNLIQAYLSDKAEDVDNFEKEFDSYMQDEGLTYKDYKRYEGLEGTTEEYKRLLKGAITYRVNSAKTRYDRIEVASFYEDEIADMRKDKELNNEILYSHKNGKFKQTLLDLEEHIHNLVLEKDFSSLFTTRNIGKSTISSSTDLKRNVEYTETKENEEEKEKTDEEKPEEEQTGEENEQEL